MRKLFKKAEECCGCGACAQICPKKCISMTEDKIEGFSYPKLDRTSCIHCNLCSTICPLKDETLSAENRNAFAMLHCDENYRLACTSSGAFEIICRNFCQNERCVVFGAVMDENLIVKHTYALDINNLEQFRKSKYVQSDLGDSYHLVKRFLDNNCKVVFSGTPCQIDGLKHYLKKDWQNLLTVDFVCHGVPSPRTFKMCINELSKIHGNKVKKVIFRNKVWKNGEWNCLGMKYEYEDGTVFEDMYPPCAYMENFLNNLYLRPSCHTCKYASMRRVSDITLGDSWGMDVYKKELSMKYTNGTSLLMLNTEKGKALIEIADSSYEIEQVPIEMVLKDQQQLVKPAKAHRRRNRFFELSRFSPYSKAVEVATKKNRLSYYLTVVKFRLKNFLFNCYPFR